MCLACRWLTLTPFDVRTAWTFDLLEGELRRTVEQCGAGPPFYLNGGALLGGDGDLVPMFPREAPVRRLWIVGADRFETQALRGLTIEDLLLDDGWQRRAPEPGRRCIRDRARSEPQA